MSLSALRKHLGVWVFNQLIHPPHTASPRVRQHGEDYGHGLFYEELFCRDSLDLERVASLCSTTSGSILDLAGGAGRLSARLASQGNPVVLVDKSKSMLRLAVARRELLPLKVRDFFTICEQDIRSLDLAERFSHIISLNHGLEHLRDEGEIGQTIARLTRYLEPGGTLLIDLHQPGYWAATPEWKTGRWVYSADLRFFKKHWRMWNRTEKGKRKSEVIWEHALSGNLIQFTLSRTRLNLLCEESWEGLFEGAGLRTLERWGSWNGDPISDKQPKMIFQLGF